MPAQFSERDVFWRNREIHLVTGSILNAVSDFPAAQRNMATVRDILHRMARGASRGSSNLFGSAAQGSAIESMHPDAQRINELLDLGSTDTVGGMVHTALEGVGFVQGAMMEESLRESSFSLDDVTEGAPMTIYLVLPPHMLLTHSGLLRLWFGALFGALLRRRARPARATLLMLDEAAQLGQFNPLRTAVSLLRGYGVQTWSFWQDVSQLSNLYPNDWRSMINNCGVLQLFGMKSELAWQEAARGLSMDLIGLGSMGDRMLIQLQGKSIVADRVDYRTDPAFTGAFDPNPAYQKTVGRLRRPAKKRIERTGTTGTDVFANIANVLKAIA